MAAALDAGGGDDEGELGGVDGGAGAEEGEGGVAHRVLVQHAEQRPDDEGGGGDRETVFFGLEYSVARMFAESGTYTRPGPLIFFHRP